MQETRPAGETGPPQHADEAEWAMQVVVRVEKSAPPSHDAACEAAAMAVVRLLTAAEAAGGEWRERVRRWESGPIRKVARRARGVRWHEAQDLPGVTVEHAGAQARAFVPGPMDAVPPRLARLQVAGLDLRDLSPGTAGALELRPGRAADVPAGAPYAVIALNPEAPMSTGKAAAQCGHAAHLLLRGLTAGRAAAWTAAGLPVQLAGGVPWPESVAGAAVAVRDAGFTEVPPGTMTAVARLVC